MRYAIVAVLLAAAGLSIALSGPAAADAVSDFYHGNTVRFLIGSDAGGGTDTTGRIIAQHLSRHIPGTPRVIAQNMPGSGGIAMTNNVYNVLPQDGTVIGYALPGIIEAQLFYPLSAKFDGHKINWIGSTSRGTGLLSVLKPAPAESVEAAKATELIIGATGPGSGAYTMPLIAAKMLGLKLKLVSGYTSGHAVAVAAERGEVHGFLVSTSSWVQLHSDWLKSGRVAHIVQVGPRDMRNFPDVPTIGDLITDPRKKRLLAVLEAGPTGGWPLMAGPGVPDDRVAALRKAFHDMLVDPEFMQDMTQKARVDLDPTSGEKLGQFAREVLDTPADIVEEAKAILELK